MKHSLILKIVAKFLIPVIVLFALYVQFHGDYGPGGGFQAGVIFATGFVLYDLVFGEGDARVVVPPAWLPRLAALGVLIYGGVGLLAMPAMHLAEQRADGVAVVAAAHVGLYGKQFAGLFQCHGRVSGRVILVNISSPQRRRGRRENTK
mgnify:CR=1 FL=1